MPAQLIRLPLFPAATPAPADVSGSSALRGLAPRARPRSADQLWAGVHLAAGAGAISLEQLAERAQRFTPRVALVPPDGLQLEVKGSLHLFGGVEGLHSALEAECRLCHFTPALAFAPTPLAALVAARAGRALRVSDPAQLNGQLATLPLGVLRWPEDTVLRLSRMGIRTVGAVLRLPRAGFARRFGSAALLMLDQLTGRVPQVVTAFRARERFRRRRDLGYEVSHHAALLVALAPLLDALEQFLRTRQCALVALECRLLHRQHAPTCCVVPLARPCADGAHLQGLLQEYLSQLQLPAPVRACELRAQALVPLRAGSHSLWQPGEHGGDEQAVTGDLLERLQARLGPHAVHGLALRAGHRPESAWAVVGPPAAGGVSAAAAPLPASASRRPLWLLPIPQPLTVHQGLPYRRGALRLVSEPERIETGWWDDTEVARDYYTALDEHGVRLWVFRERSAPHGWFLHGFFG
jgi:protein ImuB